jgi:hypothetical protein
MTKNWFALLIVSATLCSTLQAQQEMPRTEHGHPDLQGTYTFRTLTPLQRPTELADKATLTREEAAEWAAYENRRQNRDLIIDSVGGAGYPPGVISYNEFWYERGTDTVGDYRTSLVFDPPNGRLPPLSAIGRERAAYTQQVRRESAGPEARTLNDRCIINNRTGPPMVSGSYNNNMQLVQTEHHVMIMTEMVHHARIIPFASDHGAPFSQWTGNSIARWENNTLVISTQNFYPDYGWRNTSPEMKIEERISWLDENTLDYEFTVDDPNTWAQSWSARLPMSRMSERIYEFACHEGNHGLAGILAGWRRWEIEGKNSGSIPSVDD